MPYAKYVTPLVKIKVAPLLKDKLIPCLKDLIDEELDTIIEKDPKASRLKKRINKQLNDLLTEATQKN